MRSEQLQRICNYLNQDREGHMKAHGDWQLDPGKLQAALDETGAERTETQLVTTCRELVELFRTNKICIASDNANRLDRSKHLVHTLERLLVEDTIYLPLNRRETVLLLIALNYAKTHIADVNDDYEAYDEDEQLHVPGKIAYAVLSFGGLLGMGDKLFAVPWAALALDTVNKRFTLNVAINALKDAPGFNKECWPSMSDRTWASGVHKFYGTAYGTN